jgi:hypothetical protein
VPEITKFVGVFIENNQFEKLSVDDALPVTNWTPTEEPLVSASVICL